MNSINCDERCEWGGWVADRRACVRWGRVSWVRSPWSRVPWCCWRSSDLRRTQSVDRQSRGTLQPPRIQHSTTTVHAAHSNTPSYCQTLKLHWFVLLCSCRGFVVHHNSYATTFVHVKILWIWCTKLTPISCKSNPQKSKQWSLCMIDVYAARRSVGQSRQRTKS